MRLLPRLPRPARLRRRRAARRGSTGPTITYAPKADGRPDPGEVVWGWVPYEEDPRQGKDRPVLLIGTDGRELLGLMLTSKDHDRDAEQEARWGRHWMDVGSGGWDRERRPSEVRLDRLLRLDPAAVRREGAALDPAVFQKVIDAARRHHAFG
jgi:hypothetical protein